MSPYYGQILLEQVMPIIAGAVPKSVKVVGCEDSEELIQDCLVIAAMMLESLERNGKQPIAKSVAYYSIQRIKSGRRSYSSGRTDVLSTAAQLDGVAVIHSLNEPVNPVEDETEGMTIGDMLACDTEDPSVTAGRDIDWSEFNELLSDRERVVLRGLSEGHGTGELAQQCGVSAPRICQIKEEIAEEITERWGSDVLQSVSREPQWRSSLRAKERVAV